MLEDPEKVVLCENCEIETYLSYSDELSSSITYKSLVITEYCPHINSLEPFNLSDLHHLTLIRNNLLTSISPLPNLETLILFQCENLLSVPYIPTLKELRVISCPKITIIPKFSKLYRLGVSNSEINNIPIFPRLRCLYINNCPNITRLPKLSNLIQLECHNCANLLFLPMSKSLVSLDISDCRKCISTSVIRSRTIVDSPWINGNIELVVKLQRFFRRVIIRRHLEKLLRDELFLSILYNPDGKNAMRIIRKVKLIYIKIFGKK